MLKFFYHILLLELIGNWSMTTIENIFRVAKWVLSCDVIMTSAINLKVLLKIFGLFQTRCFWFQSVMKWELNSNNCNDSCQKKYLLSNIKHLLHPPLASRFHLHLVWSFCASFVTFPKKTEGMRSKFDENLNITPRTYRYAIEVELRIHVPIRRYSQSNCNAIFTYTAIDDFHFRIWGILNGLYALDCKSLL